MDYAGFISYSGSAGPMAARLHKALERYAIPKPLRGTTTEIGQIGKTAGKFFVDRAELSATRHLKADIEAALEASRFLIVLCSPEAAQSVWVPLEIAYFKRLGRGDRIIPVLVGGEPVVYDPQTAPNGAFPKALLEEGGADLPLAPDLREEDACGEGFDTAMLRVMARLLGLEFPELTQRHLVAEREKQRVRNRVIAALSILLVMTIAGGWTAWTQKQAADRRLAQALDSAARQVQLASGFRERYGVPSSVAAELFGGAAQDFAAIVADAGDNPMLVLQRARYSLGMADLAADTQGSATQGGDFLSKAQDDLARAKGLIGRWYAPFWFAERPAPEAILREEIVALRAEARVAARTGQRAVAQDLASRAFDLADALAGAAETLNAVYGRCALADIQYELNDVGQALSLRQACLAGARKLWDGEALPAHEMLLARALIDTGMLLRLQRAKQVVALGYLKEAVGMGRKGLDGSNEARVLAAEALVNYADTLNLMDVEEAEKVALLEEQLDLFRSVETILGGLIASDANRRDWKILQATNVYRLAGILGRLAHIQDTNSAERLDEADAYLSENIAMAADLVARAPDDVSLKRMHSALLESRAETRIMRTKSQLGAARNVLITGARDDLDQVTKIREIMVDAYPGYDFFRRDLANAYLTKGRLLTTLGDQPDTVEPDFAAARAIFESLSELEGFRDWSARDLALTDFHQARLYASHGQTVMACTFARKSLEIVAPLQEAHPGDQRIENEARQAEALVEEACAE